MELPAPALLSRLPGCAGLDAAALAELEAAAHIRDLTPDERLLVEGEPAPDWVAVVASGAVRVSGREAEGAGTLDELGVGDVLDPGPAGDALAWSATATAPTRCLLVPRAALAARRGRLVEPARAAGPGDVALFAARVRDLVKGAPVTCPADTPIAAAAGRMVERGVGSIVVTAGDGRPVGIVTDRDLRTRVVAAGRAPDTPVSAIMSAPVATIDAGAPAWEALLEMTRRNVHHLGVADGARLIGIVSTTDIVRLQGAHPVALAREIDAQDTIDGLAAVAPRVPLVVRWLRDGGAAVGQIARIVAELNDRLVRGAVGLAEAGLRAEGAGGAPVPYAWLAAGSEGRREQTLKTDQDNGLVFADPPGAAPDVAPWFHRLAARAAGALERLGFPPCPGGYMASNPRWCLSLHAWRRQFEDWMDTPQPQAVLHASVFLDLRGVAGDPGPAAALRDWLTERAPDRHLFLRHLARDAVGRRPPLGLFGGFVVERSGAHKDRLDLKARGVFPVTQAARVEALALGAPATGTLDRLAAAAAHGRLTPAELHDLVDAWEILSRLRLGHQLACLDAGVAPDNHVDPASLGRTDRVLLKEAFRAVEWLQRSLEDRFQTATVA